MGCSPDPQAAMFEMKEFSYDPDAVRFSGKLLDAEHSPNMRILQNEEAPNRLRAAILARFARSFLSRPGRGTWQMRFHDAPHAPFGFFRGRAGRAAAPVEMFSANAARMNAFSACSSILSPSWKSMARLGVAFETAELSFA
jgi:hypothetical protein